MQAIRSIFFFFLNVSKIMTLYSLQLKSVEARSVLDSRDTLLSGKALCIMNEKYFDKKHNSEMKNALDKI